MSNRYEAGSPNRREEGTPRRMPRSSERGGSHIAELLRVAKLSVIALAQDQARDAEIEAFEAVRAPVGVAEYRIGVLSADIERHLLSLRQNIRIRTAEGQASLSLADLESIIGELLVAREKLLGVLGRSEKVK